MPTFVLRPHPANPPTYADRVEAYAERTTGQEIAVRFRLFGDLNLLHLAPAHREAKRIRRDELWRTTCFECFCRPTSADHYVELNLAPNGDWAAYSFTGYRAGLANASATTDRFRVKGFSNGLQVSATFELPALSGEQWTFGLSAVVESIDGSQSYWALAHAPGPPDFHNPACFTATLPAPGVP